MGNMDHESQKGEILIYPTADGHRVECRFVDETIWLNINQMADLFDVDKSGISRHLKKIFETGELRSEATVAKFATVQSEGGRQVSRDIEFYNLDAIISVGYRVSSIRGTHFRMWATERLREYIVKGFTMDDERLKNPPVEGSGVPDYFDEMLERIRDIRTSERRMYLRVKEIFALAGDYDPSLKESRAFFAQIQNKLHFAATGLTAPELIQERADSSLLNMGLTSWKGSEIRKPDVVVAKNYLGKREIDELNRIVVMWLDYAEDQARRRKQVFFADWSERLDQFLEFNERNVLPDKGRVSKQTADDHAKGEYKKYAVLHREIKEQAGEADAIKTLEELANKKRL